MRVHKVQVMVTVNNESTWQDVADLPTGDIREFKKFMVTKAEPNQIYRPITTYDICYEIEESVKKTLKEVK